MSSGFRDNILATLAYYDVFDFSLKNEEVFGFLVNFKRLQISVNLPVPTFEEARAELEKLIGEKIVDFAGSFYFLFGRSYLVPLRLRREKIAREKWVRAFRAVWWLKFLPYIKAVFASGSLAMSNMDELGDLDVLIVAKHGRIWLTRLLVSGLLSLSGVRRKYNDKIAPDKICPNHYITDKSLNIPHKSIYTAQTYINLKPLFVPDPQIISEFYKANSWLSEYILNFNASSKLHDIIKGELGRSFLARFKAAAWEMILDSRFGDWLEGVARRWQTKRIEEHKKQDPPGGRVVYNDEQLEFHPGSVEKEIVEKYNQRMRQLDLGGLAIEKDSGA